MNFNELYKKIATIDSTQTLKEDGHAAVEECGMPMPMPMPHAMPQQDSVSMNVSMNAQGKNGIRDLMNVLKNIEDSVAHGDVGAHSAELHHPEDDLVGKEVEIDGPTGAVEIDTDDGHDEGDMAIIDGEAGSQEADKPAIGAKEKIAAAIASGAVDEEFANRPDVSHKSINFMTKDMSGGLNNQKTMHKHGYRNGDNPLAMESLVSSLSSLYQEVQLREGDKKTMSRAAKGNEKYGKDGMKALAKAGREGASEKKLDAIRDKHDHYNESINESNEIVKLSKMLNG